MKLIKRILYAFIVSFGMFLVFSITDSQYKLKNINKLGKEAIDNNNIEFFIGAKFYNEAPLYEKTITASYRTYNIFIYDSGFFVKDNNQIKSISGLNVIIHQTDGVLLPERLYAKAYNNFDEELSYTLIRVGNLPIYTIIDFDNKNLPIVLFDKFENKENNTIEKITIAFNQDGAIILTLDDLNLKKENMLVSNKLNEFYRENNKIPSENFGIVKLNKDNLKLSSFLSWLWVGVYLIIVILVSWFYIYYKKHLKRGKRPISPGLKKDIEKQNRT